MIGGSRKEDNSGGGACPNNVQGAAPFFIVGAGRSGTTLLQAMLTRQPRIAIPPETHFFCRFDPSIHFSDPLRDDQVEQYAAWATSQPWWMELGLDAKALRTHIDDGGRSAASILLWMLRTLTNECAPRLGEKTPRHEKRLARILEVFPDAKIIHIYRDPRDVVASLQREPWMAGQSVQRVARHVRGTLARQRAAARQLGPDRYAVIRYESLVAQPERELRRLCAFLGETFCEEMLRFHERAEPGYLPSEAAWKHLTMAPLDPSRHGRYRTLLSLRDIRTVERVVGPQLSAYDYEREPGEPDRLVWRASAMLERTGWWVKRLARSARKRLRTVHIMAVSSGGASL